MAKLNGFDIVMKMNREAEAEQFWNSLSDGEHKCKIYFKLKNGRTLLDSNYMSSKILTKKDVEFLRSRNTQRNFLKKLALIKNAKPCEVELLKFEKRYFEEVELNESMLDDMIRLYTSIKEKHGKINLSKDVNFKIIVKFAD